MSYNELKSLVTNVEAIATAMKIRIDDRQATSQEKEALSRYSGLGGIEDMLSIGTEHTVSNDVAEHIHRLQDLIEACPYYDDAMRRAVIDSIKSSILTAFYMPKFLIDAVARQIHATFMDNGLQMHTFFEPSAGIDGFLPVAMPDTRGYAFEKDCLTGLILSLLHGKITTVTADFETIADQHLERGSFDVIASNIPFGNFRVFDVEMWKKGGMREQSAKTIHNYSFVKAMELLDEDGLLAFAMSRGIADTPGNKFVREYLVNHADLITALRLPDTLFMQTSGIEAGSDLLIFQKRSHKATLSLRKKMFLQVSKEKADTVGTMIDYANKIFTLPKTVLATDSRIALNQSGKCVRKYQWLGDENAMSRYLSALLKYDLDRYFHKALFGGHGQDNAPVQMSLFGELQTAKGIRVYTEDMETWMKNGAMVVFEGQVGTLRPRKSSRCTETTVDFMPVDDGKINTDKVADYFPIRKTYFELSGREREE